MRRFAFVFSAVVVLVAFTMATADEFLGSVTKFEGGKITFKKGFGGFGGKKGDKGKAEEITLTVAANAKFNKGKFGEEKGKIDADGALEGGREAFAKLVKEAAEKKPDPDKKGGKKGGKGFGGFGGGVFAYIITEGEGEKATVTEIRVIQFGGKKKGGGE
jgi:hypothetical protein